MSFGLGLLGISATTCGQLPTRPQVSYEINSSSRPLSNSSSAEDYRRVYENVLQEYGEAWIPDRDERRVKKIETKWGEAQALYQKLADPKAAPAKKDPAFQYKMAIQDAAFEVVMYRKSVAWTLGFIGVASVLLLLGGIMLLRASAPGAPELHGRLGVMGPIFATLLSIVPTLIYAIIGAPFMLLCLGLTTLSFILVTIQPGPVHPMIQNMENEIAMLPPSDRASVVKKKILVGLAIAGVGIILTGATIAIPFVTVGFVGLIAFGILKAGTALAVNVRLSAR